MYGSFTTYAKVEVVDFCTQAAKNVRLRQITIVSFFPI